MSAVTAGTTRKSLSDLFTLATSGSNHHPQRKFQQVKARSEDLGRKLAAVDPSVDNTKISVGKLGDFYLSSTLQSVLQKNPDDSEVFNLIAGIMTNQFQRVKVFLDSLWTLCDTGELNSDLVPNVDFDPSTKRLNVTTNEGHEFEVKRENFSTIGMFNYEAFLKDQSSPIRITSRTGLNSAEFGSELFDIPASPQNPYGWRPGSLRRQVSQSDITQVTNLSSGQRIFDSKIDLNYEIGLCPKSTEEEGSYLSERIYAQDPSHLSRVPKTSYPEDRESDDTIAQALRRSREIFEVNDAKDYVLYN